MELLSPINDYLMQEQESKENLAVEESTVPLIHSSERQIPNQRGLSDITRVLENHTNILSKYQNTITSCHGDSDSEHPLKHAPEITLKKDDQKMIDILLEKSCNPLQDFLKCGQDQLSQEEDNEDQEGELDEGEEDKAPKETASDGSLTNQQVAQTVDEPQKDNNCEGIHNIQLINNPAQVNLIDVGKDEEEEEEVSQNGSQEEKLNDVVSQLKTLEETVEVQMELQELKDETTNNVEIVEKVEQDLFGSFISAPKIEKTAQTQESNPPETDQVKTENTDEIQIEQDPSVVEVQNTELEPEILEQSVEQTQVKIEENHTKDENQEIIQEENSVPKTQLQEQPEDPINETPAVNQDTFDVKEETITSVQVEMVEEKEQVSTDEQIETLENQETAENQQEVDVVTNIDIEQDKQKETIDVQEEYAEEPVGRQSKRFQNSSEQEQTPQNQTQSQNLCQKEEQEDTQTTKSTDSINEKNLILNRLLEQLTSVTQQISPSRDLQQKTNQNVNETRRDSNQDIELSETQENQENKDPRDTNQNMQCSQTSIERKEESVEQNVQPKRNSRSERYSESGKQSENGGIPNFNLANTSYQDRISIKTNIKNVLASLQLPGDREGGRSSLLGITKRGSIGGQRTSISNVQEQAPVPVPAEQQKSKKNVLGNSTRPDVIQRQIPKTIEDLVQINTSTIKFNTFMPGNILEETLEINNKHTENIVVRVVATCLNKQFDALDEYVYSIRKTTSYDYNERYFVLIPPFSTMTFKVAVKVPNTKKNGPIAGNISINVQDIDGSINIPINGTVDIPSVICSRELFHQDHECSVIKLAIQKSQKMDSKIPFKNTSSTPLILDVDWLKLDDQNEEYDMIIHPSTVSVAPKGLFAINFMARGQIGFSSTKTFNPQTTSGNGETEITHLRKILLLQVRNSSVIFSFPIWIQIY